MLLKNIIETKALTHVSMVDMHTNIESMPPCIYNTHVTFLAK
jgi:hypothetical protein